MIERIYILESVDPVIFYGVNNVNMQLIKTLFPKLRIVARGIAETESGKIKEIREHLGMETNEFNPYRKRLMKKGIVSGETRGYVFFTLPLFERYVIDTS